MAEDLQKKITDFYVKQKMLYGGDIVVEVTLKENGKAYITNVKVPERLHNNSEWISGYWFNEKEFATLEELCDYYGITKDGLKDLMSRHQDLEHSVRIAELRKVYYGKKCSVRKISNALKVNYRQALRIRKKNDLNIEQLIQHYNPYCYFNIQGEFIIN